MIGIGGRSARSSLDAARGKTAHFQGWFTDWGDRLIAKLLDFQRGVREGEGLEEGEGSWAVIRTACQAGQAGVTNKYIMGSARGCADYLRYLVGWVSMFV